HGVCRRVLRDAHHADDACQATLLVLARKAQSIASRASLAGWLYQVAYRVALRARDGVWRRARHERQLPRLPPVVDPRAAPLPDGRGRAREEERNRLAEKHRAPVVLCYLEGLTNEEAARQLCWPVGTVKTRLTHARRLLSQRLARRGLAPALGAVAAGALPPALVAAAVGAAGKGPVLSTEGTILAEGGLRAMMVTKLKLTAAALAVGLLVAGAGTASYRAWAAEPAAQETTPAQARVKRLREQIGALNKELRRAEEEAAREQA